MPLVDSQKITSDLQQYIGSNSKELMTQIYTAMDFWNDVLVLPDVKNETRLTQLFINDIVKPFNPEFNPTTDAIEFKPRTIGVKTGKAELRVVPEEYRQTYLAQFMKPSVGRSPEDLPFSKFILDSIMQKIGEEINNTTAYFGVYDGAGSGAEDVADGWGTKLAAMIIAAEIAPETQGIYTSSNGYSNLKTLARSVPEKFLRPSTNLKAFMSLKTYWKIMDQIITLQLNVGRGYDPMQTKWVPGFEGIVEMKPVSWMNGSDRVFITPQDNIVVAADATQQDLATMNVVPEMWSAQLGIGFAIGFDFRAAGLIWLNDAV